MFEPPATSCRHVFVYGTLRRGDVRDITRLQPQPRFAGMGSVAGVLYHLGSYPGLVLGGQGRVTGEVYEVTAELERQLDQIEEVWPQQAGEYHKRDVMVRLHEGALADPRELPCFVYEADPARVVARPVIGGGDWVEGRHLHP